MLKDYDTYKVFFFFKTMKESHQNTNCVADLPDEFYH